MSQTIKNVRTGIDSAYFYKQLRKIIKDNENGKLARKELKITRNSLDTARLALAIKDTIIHELANKDTTRLHQLKMCNEEIVILNEKLKRGELEIKHLNSERTKEKRRKIVFQMLSAVVTAITGWLIITK